MNIFLSCDWGTSSFRLRLVQRNGLQVLSEQANGDGIAGMFKKWTAEGTNERDRLPFYQSYIHEQIKKIEAEVGSSLHEVPLIVSGMASSSIGMTELPYKDLPFNTDGSDLNVHTIAPSEGLPNKVVIISGAKTGDDVMRGEETLLIGCAIEKQEEESISIFPGTHSKHIRVRAGLAQHFKTYMTGEFFDLLATKSILSNSVEWDETDDTASVNPHFEKGILEGASTNLLSSVFHVRTAQLFQKHIPKENYQYLSGLLIGTELNELVQHPPSALALVSGERLKKKYERGLTLLGLDKNLQSINADAALISGQLRIYEAMENKPSKNGPAPATTP